jgi:NAD(P)-dependent dehydrogenase (short-subunit alcohol dehydrogenase family)
MDFSNKRILVIGASSGIGKQIAIDLDALGAELVLVSRDREKLETLNKLLKSKEHMVYSCDFSIPSSLQPLCMELKESAIPFDGMVYSAGISKTKALHTISYEDYQSIFNINVFSAMHFTAFLSEKSMHNENGSSIVFISSVTSIRGTIGTSLYNASKGALAAFSCAAAAELARKKIRVNSISPGWTHTPMTDSLEKKLPRSIMEKMREQYLLGFGNPEDVSNLATFLLSPLSKWITGQNIVIDGGATSWIR